MIAAILASQFRTPNYNQDNESPDWIKTKLRKQIFDIMCRLSVRAIMNIGVVMALVS
jgi:hypothetical protein